MKNSICGYKEIGFKPYVKGVPAHESCPICGFEYGFDDLNSKHNYTSKREDWIVRGHTWYPYGINLINWPEIVNSQLKNIKDIDFREYPVEQLMVFNPQWPPYVDWEQVKDLLDNFFQIYGNQL